jgi:hypothetical protein
MLAPILQALMTTKADELARELVALFTAQNTSQDGTCTIPATFMRVTVSV